MGEQEGIFIVIEGSDGSGKATQLERIRSQLTKAGHDVVTFSFPQYEEPSSHFVRQYLHGAYGTIDEVSPYTASLFFALDRYEAAPKIRAALKEGKVVLADRYVGSNMAHQGTKFRHAEERRGYFIWLDNLEFEMLGIPRPTISFVLRVPAETAVKLIEQREQENPTSRQRDIHEKSLDHLKHALTVYDDMCQLFPKDFVCIDCMRDKNMLDPATIQDIIWQKIEPYLPEPSKRHSAATVSTQTISNNPYIVKNKQGVYELTQDGRAFLESTVTSVTGDVYAFTDKLAPLVIAAAMTQRTKRVDDLRLTLLEEYAPKRQSGRQREALMVAGSDATAKRLSGMHMVVENASTLLMQILERDRLATYVDLSSPYTYLDQKDSHGDYAYYIPPELDETTQALYHTHMDRIFDRYAQIIERLTAYLSEISAVPAPKRNAAWTMKVRADACQAAAAVLPIATTTTAGIFAPVDTLERLTKRLLSNELPEAQNVGKHMVTEASKIIPGFGGDNKTPRRQDPVLVYKAARRQVFRAVTNSVLSQHHAAADQTPAQLTDVWPRNEFDLLADMMYEESGLSIRELKTEITSWPYAKKLEAFNAYVGPRQAREHIPGRALEKAHYSWDLTCSYSTFRNFQRRHLVDGLVWQALTPRYGYDLPKLIEEAQLEELFQACFDTSLQLYGILQEKGLGAEAQYVTLLGHKLRWKVTYNAREAFRIHEQAIKHAGGNREYQQLLADMHQKLTEVHPLIGEAMRFANATT